MSDATAGTTGTTEDVPKTMLLLGLTADSVTETLKAVEQELVTRHPLEPEAATELAAILRKAADSGVEFLGHGVAMVHCRVKAPGLFVQLLVGLDEDTALVSRDGDHLDFLWVLLSDSGTHPHLDSAVEFARLMAQPVFREAANAATTYATLDAAYEQALARDVDPGQHHIPDELASGGGPFKGIAADIRRRLPLYASDFTDGLNSKSIASIFFLFFACLAPAVAFGGLLSVLTDGNIGAVEMIVATAICGTVYSLFSGQPLTILGSTGPVIIFMGILYSLTDRLGIDYMATLAWVGFWTAGFLFILAVLGACSWIRYFTRFTDDTFAALISLIFVFEALKDIVNVFTDHKVSHSTALLSLILALGTYGIARALGRFRQSVYLRRAVREFVADFGPAIAIGAMTGVAFLLHEVELETLAVPDTFSTTSGRSWIVNPFLAPQWVWFAAAVPGVLLSILLYLDQNITVRLVNNAGNKLQKGPGYHLDLALVAVLVAVCSVFGLPWMVAATVRSLNHVRSLATVESTTGAGGATEETIVGVVETRVSSLGVHVAIGLSLLALPILKLVPMSVLFGLFLFMGVASMKGNQLFERLRLFVMDPERYPTTSYLRAVPTGVVHRFTLIQSVALGVLWVVKTSAVGILFPLFIGLLVPVRMGLSRIFTAEHLALLDAEEELEDEEHRETE